jgi:hypothetical protein
VPGLNPAHGLRRTGEVVLRAVARRPTARPSSHPARPARGRHGARAPPVVTARRPRAQLRAGIAGSVQPSDEVRRIRRGQLAQEEGRCRARRDPRGRTEVAARQRGGGVDSRRRCSGGGRLQRSSAASGGEWYYDKGGGAVVAGE